MLRNVPHMAHICVNWPLFGLDEGICELYIRVRHLRDDGDVDVSVSLQRVAIRALTVLLMGSASVAHSQAPPLPKLSELDFRSAASVTATPVFPEDAYKAHKTGVAVALVSTDPQGTVIKVEVLESPSPSIAHALTDALEKWRFVHGTMEGRPTGILGKITYYFLIQEGRPVVLSPENAPFVGARWPIKPPFRNRVQRLRSLGSKTDGP